MIAIIGATGSLGREVAARLLAAGTPVVAVTRAADKAADLAARGAEVRVADLTDHGSLARAVEGADTVFAAAHGLLGRGRNVSSRVDDAGHRALIDAARDAGIAHFVYTSAHGASPTHPVEFWRTKFGIEEYVKASGLSYTILRPTAFMETHAHELLGKAILAGKPANIFGPGNRPLNFVAVRDVAALAVRALTDPLARGATIEIGGPENLTRLEVAALYARLSGRPLATRHLSLGALKILSAMLRPLHPGISGVMRASIEFETIDQTFDATGTLQRFPCSLTTLETFVRERVESTRPR